MKPLIPSSIIAAALTATVSAGSIALNFAENDANQVFAGGNNIGPTSIDSSNWNNTIDRDSGTLATGSLSNLIDDSGAMTATTVSWGSDNVYYNREDGTGNDQRKLSVGYLDDTNSNISINFSGITYSSYRIYILLSSDEGQTTATNYTVTDNIIANGLNVTGQIINGNNTGANVTAYGSIVDALNGAGSEWVELTGDGAGSQTQTGNYLVLDGLSGDLTITSGRNGGRGSIAGIIIEDTTIPEPGTFALVGLGGIAFLLRRRK